MKGLALKYPIMVILLMVFLIVGLGIVKHFYKPINNGVDNFPPDVSYMCIQLNNTLIGFQDFQDILYGFLTDQCNGFQAEINQKVTISDIRRVTGEIDPSVQVILIDECRLPEVNSHTVYVNFTEIEKNIYLSRREIMNSDVLICGV